MGAISNKILKTLASIDRPLSPKEIASIARLNPSSVRVVLTRLLKKGLVERKFHGHYVTSTILGVRYGIPPRIQNLFVIATSRQNGEKLGVLKSETVEFGLGDGVARLRLVFGVKRDKIHWTVKAPIGLDLYGFRLATELVDSECKRRGVFDAVWMVKNFELLWDSEGLRLEGVKALTLEGLDGVLEKYYNKDDGLRREVRSSIPAELDSLLALVQGGVPTFQLIQGVGVLTRKMDDLTDAIKGGNRVQSDTTRLVNAMWKSHQALVDRLGSLEVMFREVLKRLG